MGGEACQCPDKNCNSCEVTAEGSICKACRNSMYLFDGACHDSCDGIEGQTGLISSGVGTFKRRCLTDPFTCTKGKLRDEEGELLDVNYGCKCATADNTFHTACFSCEFKAGGFGEECIMCKYKQYLHNGQCVESCPEGTTATGEEKKGRTCD